MHLYDKSICVAVYEYVYVYKTVHIYGVYVYVYVYGSHTVCVYGCMGDGSIAVNVPVYVG